MLTNLKTCRSIPQLKAVCPLSPNLFYLANLKLDSSFKKIDYQKWLYGDKKQL
jgi:hypothetical protein